MTWASPDGLSKFGSPPVRTLLGALRSQFKNWITLGVLSWIALPSRCPPRGGWRRLARLPVEVRLRNRLRARCRLDEFAGFLDVWVYREYDMPGLRWDELRTVVDVGANVGAATLWFASRAPQARIIAVEPSPSAVSSLIRNVAANRLANRVEVVPAAIGATTGTGYLRASDSSISAKMDANATSDTSAVPIMSLRELLERAKIRELDLLKLDCEGAEFDILRASDARVLNSIRVIVGEFHAVDGNRREDLEQTLTRSGFAFWSVGSDEIGLFAATRVGPSRRNSSHFAARAR